MMCIRPIHRISKPIFYQEAQKIKKQQKFSSPEDHIKVLLKALDTLNIALSIKPEHQQADDCFWKEGQTRSVEQQVACSLGQAQRVEQRHLPGSDVDACACFCQTLSQLQEPDEEGHQEEHSDGVSRGGFRRG